MTDLPEYRRYHVLMLRRGRLGFLPWPKFGTFPLWGTDVSVGRWATFERYALENLYGSEQWVEDLKRILRNGLFVVEGEDVTGKRHLLTGDGTREAWELGESSPVGRPPGSGLNIWVRHGRSVWMESYESILHRAETSQDARWVSQLEAWGPDRKARLAGLRRMNADGKEPHDKWCLSCNRAKRARKRRDSN